MAVRIGRSVMVAGWAALFGWIASYFGGALMTPIEIAYTALGAWVALTWWGKPE